ncbi:MAG: hypothetical protein ACTSP4_02645 [Candidatus Hodarchaeales archaeon]
MVRIATLLNKRSLRKAGIGIVLLTAFAGILILQATVTATAPPGEPPKNELENDTNPDPLFVPDSGSGMITRNQVQPIVTSV